MKKEWMKTGKIRNNARSIVEDVVATEKTFCILAGKQEQTYVSCTPENLEEFVTGFLFSRGIIEKAEDILSLKVSEGDGRIEVSLSVPDRRKDVPSVSEERTKPENPDWESGWSEAEMFEMAEKIFEQPGTLFQETGCAHCCAYVENGKKICCYEDIGRHNALDKVLGYGLMNGIDFSKGAIYTSGRVSGDYFEKAVRAGAGRVVSRAAVTSEAVKTARKNKMLLFGFVRNNVANDYRELHDWFL